MATKTAMLTRARRERTTKALMMVRSSHLATSAALWAQRGRHATLPKPEDVVDGEEEGEALFDDEEAVADSRLARMEYFLQLKAGRKRYEALLDFFHRESKCHFYTHTSDKEPYAPNFQAHEAVGVLSAYNVLQIVLEDMASELRGRAWTVERKKGIAQHMRDYHSEVTRRTPRGAP